MLKDTNNLLTGTARSAKVSQVAAGISAEDVNLAAEVATTVIMQKYGESLGATRQEVLDVNVIGLKVALAKSIDDESDARGTYVPAYFDSMVKGLRTTIGRTVVSSTMNGSFKVVLPEHYAVTVMKMKAAGIPMVKPHRPASETSNTLALDVEEIDGTRCVVGNLKEMDQSDLVRRALLEIEQKDLALLRTLSGELALQYGEVDCLLADYFASETKVAIS
jgi:hypothetical protein